MEELAEGEVAGPDAGFEEEGGEVVRGTRHVERGDGFAELLRTARESERLQVVVVAVVLFV